ncbi:hypothetical protein ADICEAN_01148 [Cesiribacter andamanensis AMV16]|uniref:Uncharacterized protein n=1 Tax=Cesiribacter andamanensis AMV16 TaxID=1279009 RepID=M7NZD9_9BACT|nr:hypothetical protein ADICEAN_01148 [Cesiribacter andamanensis AMV16]
MDSPQHQIRRNTHPQPLRGGDYRTLTNHNWFA